MPTVETLGWPVDLLEAMERLEDSCRKRGHAPDWHAPNEFQDQMEVEATWDWAGEMNERGWKIDTASVRKNESDPPDCLAEMGGKTIGIEVTELVDRKAIELHPELLRYQGPEHFVQEFPQPPMPPSWPREKFHKHVAAIIERKDRRAAEVRTLRPQPSRDNPVSSEFLLIVTGEPRLDETTLAEYLRTIKLQRPRYFDGVFVMKSYVHNPDGKGHGHHPVFEVPFSD